MVSNGGEGAARAHVPPLRRSAAPGAPHPQALQPEPAASACDNR
jgi:hypothetical protein